MLWCGTELSNTFSFELGLVIALPFKLIVFLCNVRWSEMSIGQNIVNDQFFLQINCAVYV